MGPRSTGQFHSLMPIVFQFRFDWQACMCIRRFEWTILTTRKTTIFFAKPGNHTHHYMIEPIRLLPSKPLLPCDLPHIHYNFVMGLDSCWLCTLCAKLVRKSEHHTLIQCCLWSHSATFSHLQPNPFNPCTNFSHNHSVHSQLRKSLVKFWNIESRYSHSHVLHENVIFLVSEAIIDLQRQ